MRVRHFAILFAAVSANAAGPLTPAFIAEQAGMARTNYLLTQGIPVPPLDNSEASRVCVTSGKGGCLPATISPEGRDENGKVRWLRLEMPVRMPAWRKLPLQLTIATATPRVPDVEREHLRFRTPDYSVEFKDPDWIRLTAKGRILLEGRLGFQVYPDIHSIVGGGAATTILTPFRASGFTVTDESPGRAVIVLRGRVPKQKTYSYTKGDIDPLRGFECEVRFHLNSLSPVLRYEWRLTNQCGWKSWLERYALVLPLASGFRVIANQAGIHNNLGSWAVFENSGSRVAFTAPFVADLGDGAGMRLENRVLLHGGVDMPLDGALTGPVPQVHRQFHAGMSRTFEGTILVGGTAEQARAQNEALDIVLPAAYYSRTGALPEGGDDPHDGDFREQIDRAANWLLHNQWRGTLWWGEWWREFDQTRRQGAEEASNGNSAVAPLFHYYRSGDGRFLQCARRAASYTYDVQFNRDRSGPGPFLHARRHLLDEQDWVHPRYQRLAGALLASHTLLATTERGELIAALRGYTDKLMDGEGRMHNWDRRANAPGGPAGVDTSNIQEALVACWRETGDRTFLEKAVRMSRWTISQWREGNKDWNWNLSQYVLRGLLAVAEAMRDPETIGTAIAISRHVIANPQLGGDLHFVFYNAWLAAELNRLFGANLPLDRFAAIVRGNLDKMGPDGSFPVALPEAWTPYPSIRSSYYDSKAFVAYIPALTARLERKESTK